MRKHKQIRIHREGQIQQKKGQTTRTIKVWNNVNRLGVYGGLGRVWLIFFVGMGLLRYGVGTFLQREQIFFPLRHS